MNKTRLLFRGISEIVGTTEMGLLILADQSNKRQIAIICDKSMEHAFSMRMGNTAICSKMLPEILCGLNPEMNGEHYEVTFLSIVEGEYQSVLLNKETLEMTKVRASDGVLLSHIAHLDIYMEERLFLKQSVPLEKGQSKMALPINALSKQMLEQALEKAIANEDYELASSLRDELQKRQDAEK